jgi:hypothetical protein
MIGRYKVVGYNTLQMIIIGCNIVNV